MTVSGRTITRLPRQHDHQRDRKTQNKAIEGSETRAASPGSAQHQELMPEGNHFLGQLQVLVESGSRLDSCLSQPGHHGASNYAKHLPSLSNESGFEKLT
jgi:hypothetical protein